MNNRLDALVWMSRDAVLMAQKKMPSPRDLEMTFVNFIVVMLVTFGSTWRKIV